MTRISCRGHRESKYSLSSEQLQPKFLVCKVIHNVSHHKTSVVVGSNLLVCFTLALIIDLFAFFLFIIYYWDTTVIWIILSSVWTFVIKLSCLSEPGTVPRFTKFAYHTQMEDIRFYYWRLFTLIRSKLAFVMSKVTRTVPIGFFCLELYKLYIYFVNWLLSFVVRVFCGLGVVISMYGNDIDNILKFVWCVGMILLCILGLPWGAYIISTKKSKFYLYFVHVILFISSLAKYYVPSWKVQGLILL